jgi:hypothetical protein
MCALRGPSSSLRTTLWVNALQVEHKGQWSLNFVSFFDFSPLGKWTKTSLYHGLIGRSLASSLVTRLSQQCPLTWTPEWNADVLLPLCAIQFLSFVLDTKLGGLQLTGWSRSPCITSLHHGPMSCWISLLYAPITITWWCLPVQKLSVWNPCLPWLEPVFIRPFIFLTSQISEQGLIACWEYHPIWDNFAFPPCAAISSYFWLDVSLEIKGMCCEFSTGMPLEQEEWLLSLLSATCKPG